MYYSSTLSQAPELPFVKAEIVLVVSTPLNLVKHSESHIFKTTLLNSDLNLIKLFNHAVGMYSVS